MRTRRLAGPLAALALLSPPAGAAVPSASVWTPAPGVPATIDGGIRWIARPETLAADVAAWRSGVPREGAPRAEALSAWRRLGAHPRLGFAAWRRLAPLALAAGETALADSAWERLAGEGSPWAWEGTRGAVNLRLARRDTTAAIARLAEADSSRWSDAERGAWLEWRAMLAEARGDRGVALALAGRLLTEAPPSPAAARALERWGVALAAAPGFSFDRAADFEEERGRLGPAADWLGLAPGAPGDAVARRTLRRVALLRRAGRLDEAERWLAGAIAPAAAEDLRGAAHLERAWLERARGRGDALRWADSAAAIARDPVLRDSAAWVPARAAERDRRRDEARVRYGRLADARGPRAEAAALRAGWLALAVGDTADAIRRFAQGTGEAATFWSGVARRAAGRPDGDSLLRAVARLPGYAFHRTAARETLALAGWPGMPPVAPGRGSPLLELARDLAAAGLSLEAGSLIERWRAAAAATTGERMRAVQLAHALGRTALGIELAREALDRAGEAEAWAIAPWVYPPALAAQFATVPESGPVPRSLFQAVAWQESRFVPTARSRSRALGLFQLKLSTAVEVARSLRERRPTEAALFDPALSLRLGRRYLEQLVRHFGGHVPLAVAAYNAGPGSIRRARRDVAAGGDALELELLETPETWTYVRRILPAWQAYRELRPAPAP